jgi:hypothetical protein
VGEFVRGGLAAREPVLVAVPGALAADTIAHAEGHGTLRIWTEQERLAGEVTDTGRITDPLAGRHSSRPHEGGHGPRLVHQVCDFVEVRSGSFGTNIRVYRDLA